MNRLILTVSVVCLCVYNLNAQNQNDFQTVIHRIDSLKTALKNGETVRVREHRWDFNDLSVEERSRVLDYVETFYNQTEYMSFYSLGISLFVNFFDNLSDNKSNDRETQDRIARLYLDKAYYVFGDDLTNLGKVADYSDATKERLKNILEGNKTEEDIKARRLLARRDVKRLYGKEIDRKVKDIMNDLQLKGEKAATHLLDSLTHEYIEKQIRFYEQYPPLEKFTILQIGSSNDKRFISGLETVLETDYIFLPNTYVSSLKSQISSIKQACTYALAKLGVQKYIDEIFENDKDIKYGYLGTKEAFLRWLEVNFDWEEESQFTTISSYFPNPFVLMTEVRYMIKNIPKELRLPYIEGEAYAQSLLQMRKERNLKSYDPLKDEKNRDFVQKIYRLYNWIKENSDVWELPPAKDTF